MSSRFRCGSGAETLNHLILDPSPSTVAKLAQGCQKQRSTSPHRSSSRSGTLSWAWFACPALPAANSRDLAHTSVQGKGDPALGTTGNSAQALSMGAVHAHGQMCEIQCSVPCLELGWGSEGEGTSGSKAGWDRSKDYHATAQVTF